MTEKKKQNIDSVRSYRPSPTSEHVKLPERRWSHLIFKVCI